MMIYTLDLIGVFVFAISGTLSAADKKLDLFGATFAAFITALGGGTLRDVVLGSTPVIWVTDMNYLIVIVLAVILTFIFKEYIMTLKKTLFLFDTIGIGVFTIIGMEKSILLGFNPVIGVLMGVASAVMGGVLRDTFVNDIPLIFRKEVYATACIIGGVAYLLLGYISHFTELNLLLTILLIIAIRLIAVRYKLRLPVIV
ncbi:MAG: trimeric intracellular cation channel family protein [Bacteroidales bacterium]|nr:trimeric intracellular cation channel family protein [Bacteroidales bacterium]